MRVLTTPIVLEASDGVLFEVTLETASLFTTIANLIQDIKGSSNSRDAPIPLPEVTGSILALAFEYCALYIKNGGVTPSTEGRDECNSLKITDWESAFFKDIDQQQLFALILAANYLDHTHMRESACKVVAKSMMTMTDDEIRSMWGVTNDFTPDEEALFQKEKEWCAE